MHRRRIGPIALSIIALSLLAVLAWWGTTLLDARTSPGDELARKLARVQTVQGRLTISLQGVTLQQKLWVQRPLYLRTETESGPSGFAGTIVVLNPQEGWVYSRALNMATVVQRSGDPRDLQAETGTGSLLERMPDTILAALQDGVPYHRAGREQLLGRGTVRYELEIGEGDPSFPPGVLQVWLDDQYAYPLAWRDSQGRELRFTSIEFNRPIDPATFVFFPPPGAAVQRITPTP